MQPLKVLYRGFDGLDVSFNAYLPPNELDELEIARKIAEKRMGAAAIRIGPNNFDIDIAETGARGGYKYRGDTGPLGATWFFKRRLVAEPGNIRVSAKSLPLSLFSIEGVKARFAADLKAMGAKIGGPESVGRVDYAVDFLMPREFEIRPDQFVSHSHARIKEHDIAPPPFILDGGEIAIAWSGRRATSVTIGKMPGRQIIVYDKRHEVISRDKPWWFKTWDIDAKDKSVAIIRVEIRFGKRYLTEQAHIRTYDDVDRRIQPELLAALDATRYLAVPRPAGNVSRVAAHPLWEAMREQIADAFTPLKYNKAAASEILQSERRRISERRRKFIRGALVGFLAAEGYSPEEAELIAPELMRNIGEQAASDPEWFRRKFQSAEERLRHMQGDG